ncbi:serine-protein kinase ATM isoform X2 [Denticeps clupeoides]|uniref:serine-protein kinase ATM isoform X2 n=1 Tax=Denticeps clupeoides TaxID=299321 RepID=UPI0010A3340E|nr:serine-protein kinase ATM isoform X2 [Denticeps clupeoides]
MALLELMMCCKGLESEKATERKKEVDRFRRLIRQEETVKELDYSSGNKNCKQSKQLTWDAVFRFLQKFLQKETEALQSGKTTVSAITKANRQKKKQEISSLVKYFIRCANKRGPKLKCAELLSHIVDVLENPFNCSAYGEDYSSILLKDVLSIRKYWCDINQQQWHLLLNLYCGLFSGSSVSVNRVLISRIIHTLVQGCCLQTDGLTDKLFSFFSKALSNARSEKQHAVLEHLVSSLNVFLSSVAMNCRRRACSLGEELLPSLLHVWNQMRPSPVLKEEMVDLFNLQLRLHHPEGAKTMETGAHAEDWAKWQTLLYGLYDTLVTEISQIGSRGKYATGSRQIAVKENLIELTASICNQLFSQESRILEVSQAPYRGSVLDSPSSSSSKRRRVEIGWEVLREHLQLHQSDFDMIPWLQITAVLLSRYPSILPVQELVPLLSLLCQLLGEQQHRGERGPYVLRCLREVARCQALHPKLAEPELGRLWSRACALALRGVSSPQLEIPSMELLCCMTQGALVPVDRELWKLFSGSACKPSWASVLVLCQAMSKCLLPKALVSSPVGVIGREPALREAVSSWLLMREQNEESEDSSRPHLILLRDFPQNLVSRIIVSLTLKDSRAGMVFLMGSLDLNSFIPRVRKAVNVKKNTSDIECLYLQFTFDEAPSRPPSRTGCGVGVSKDPQFTLLSEIKARVEQSLMSVADHLLNCYSPESPATPPECLIRCVCLLTGVLAGFVCAGIISEDDACYSGLFQKAKSVAQELSEYISTAKNRLSEDVVLNSLKCVMMICLEAVDCLEKPDKMSSVSRKIFLRSLPSRMLSELTETCKALLLSSSKKDSLSMLVEEDQMEEEWDTSRTQVQQQAHIDLFDDGEAIPSTSDGTATPKKESSELPNAPGASSALSEIQLSMPDVVLLVVLEFLSLCCSSQLSPGLSFKPSEVRCKLLKLLDQMEYSRPLHLQMYLTLLKNLPAEDTLLSSEDFDAILRPLPDVCSLYRQDQAVCAAMLKDLLPAIQNLGRVDSVSGEESDMKHVKGTLLKVVSGFCILSRTGKSTACVRAALVHCLVALLEVDPCCKWAVLHLRDEELLVCNVLPDSLADPHHHVRMLTALAVERLFLQHRKDGLEKKCMLPLKHQQTSFENIYLKAQEGMKVQRGNPSDETFNRQATLLKSLSMVMCCSPVCEKQALFALFQSYKENGIEEHLLKKVLCSVSCALGYRSSQAFISSHLYYLVAEWLYQREKDRNYTLDSFPYTLLSHSTLEDFYRASYQVLLPHLVFLNDFEQVRSIATCLSSDWRVLLADCFPKIVVNILPYFAPSGQDVQVSQQKEKAHKVYNLLKDSNCLGKQQIDSLICSNLAEIVVELLMTLYEGGGGVEQRGDLNMFVGELDPAPNPPFFSSYVIQATLDYISKCHSANKSLVTILSKTPISIQKILLAVCQKGAETTNAYERHRILMMYHLFVGLLLREVKDGLGGAWAFVLRDVIYTLIHYINTNSTAQLDEVSTRSLSLCCDLLTRVCHTAVQFCGDALECHLQVIVGTLTAQVTDQPSISKQVLGLLRFLVVENAENNHLREAIYKLEPFPDLPAFSELRAVQQQLKSNSGAFTLKKIVHFLSVTSCDSLPRTRLEGMKDLQRLLHSRRQVGQLLRDSHADPAASVLVKVVLNLLQLCKLAQHHPGGEDILEAAGSCLGELGPVDLSTIALHHSKDEVYENAADLFPDPESRWIFIILTCMNNALTHHSIEVRQAAAQCVKDVLSSPSGSVFWDRYKSERDPMLVYLSPFRSAKKKDVALKAHSLSDARERLDSSELWLPTPGRHRDWLRGLCIALLDSGGVRTEALLLTRGLCQVKTDFCQRILPLFIHDVLLGDRGGLWRDLLSRHIQSFFTHCTRPVSSQSSRPTTPLLPDSDSEVGCQGQVDKASLRTMLAVIDYLRQQRRHVDSDSQSTGTVCDSNFWLELNYLEVSRGAQLCSAHFTALLYCEIYLDKLRSDLEESHRTKSRTSRRIIFDESSQTLSINSVSEKSMEDTGISLQELLIEVYRSIGEPDSLYGCGGGKITSALTRIRTYEHEEIWGKALTSYDLHSNLPELTRLVGIVEGLQHFGLNSILSTYLQGLQSEGVEWGTELRELRFQAAWRSSQWDCTLLDRMEKLNPGFNESVFNALQALRDKDFTTFDQILKNGRVFEMEELCRGSLEAVSSLYPALCNLQRLSELESIRPLFSRPLSDTGLGEVYSQWLQHLELLHDSEFSLVEPILALRSAMLDTLVSCEPNLDCKSILRSTASSHLMELCRLARSAGNTQLAERAVFQVKQHSTASVGLVTTTSWQLEEVQVFWVKKEQELALGLLKQMTESLEDQVACNPALVPAYAECLRLCGSWLAETCLESPAVILEMYLERAVEVIKGQSSKLHPDPKLQSQKTQAFLSLARFSDAQYKSIENYMRSSEFENKQALLKKAKEEVDLMKERNVTTNRYTVKVMRELELDVQALENLQTDRKRFLLKAVENYIRCLELGDEHDTWVFRLASLWLENSDKKSVNDAMGDGVKKIPSFKFLPLMYQLAARMGTKVSTSAGFEDVGFHDVLNELICRTCLDHPHHTLFIILALVNANKDESFSRSRLSKGSTQQQSSLDRERSEVAKEIVNEIRKKRAKMVRGIEILCDAYITLAYMDVSRYKNEKKAIPIPQEQPIMSIKDLDDVIIPTMEIKVDSSGKYENLVTVRAFKPHFYLVGGVNLPKIIDCVGSDGKSRRQLVKGQDDLRQDAVMQQVFHMCSTLLQRNAETRKRKLNIRRYKVVPFSQRSGVLEWCSGTVPIGEFLVDPQNGAHKRFRPQDWTNMDCRKKMMQTQRLSFRDKILAFTEVCKNFRPVFRYFCMERFLDPAVWLERRLAYTRSVATSSIVGYIVGLGDRHIQNILIDEQTAELVHIDLGVAFEQGKILPTPETVPFRLSRDIVDGMGITGVEGVFRRCCEKTMEVMRSSQEALLTIVEVLLYDPLFDWTMNPLKAFYLQQQLDEQAELNATLNPTPGDILEAHRKSSIDSQNFNKVAERVLLRLQEKLKGVEGGSVLSVGGQVNLLIQQAMDPKNLSRLFPGWQAWV